MKYINASKEREKCFICDAVKGKDDKASLVLYRGEYTIVIMNRYPYNNGHIMVCPKRHLKFPYELSASEQGELMSIVGKMIKVLQDIYEPEGFNIGVNIGKAAGAGEEHLHFHIVPRWIGDSNFMSVTGETRVIPDSIDNTYDKIKEGIVNSGIF
ncbi:MAG: HIT family protein [Caldisericaceae bacterium]